MDPSPSSSIAADKTNVVRGAAMSDDDIKQRLEGVCVYAPMDSQANYFMMVMDTSLVEQHVNLYFNKEDAKKALQEAQLENPGHFSDYAVVSLPLSQFLEDSDDEGDSDDEALYRLIPEPRQIVKAIKKRRWDGFKDDSFHGVPVFKSNTLVVRGEDNKAYTPVYFRLEDLHKSIAIAHEKLFQYPPLKVGHFEVADLGAVIHGMKDDSNTDWNDVTFIAPGDLPADPPPPMKVYSRGGERKVILDEF